MKNKLESKRKMAINYLDAVTVADNIALSLSEMNIAKDGQEEIINELICQSLRLNNFLNNFKSNYDDSRHD